MFGISFRVISIIWDVRVALLVCFRVLLENCHFVLECCLRIVNGFGLVFSC